MASRAIEEEERETAPSAPLADVRELCGEFHRAIAALAANDIAELEASTAAQDRLVNKLNNWFRGQHSVQLPSANISPSHLKELVALTKVYSSLLQRVLRTARLRAALCRTYRQNFPAESEPAPASGWSCEV